MRLFGGVRNGATIWSSSSSKDGSPSPPARTCDQSASFTRAGHCRLICDPDFRVTRPFKSRRPRQHDRILGPSAAREQQSQLVRFFRMT